MCKNVLRQLEIFENIIFIAVQKLFNWFLWDREYKHDVRNQKLQMADGKWCVKNGLTKFSIGICSNCI